MLLSNIVPGILEWCFARLRSSRRARQQGAPWVERGRRCRAGVSHSNRTPHSDQARLAQWQYPDVTMRSWRETKPPSRGDVVASRKEKIPTVYPCFETLNDEKVLPLVLILPQRVGFHSEPVPRACLSCSQADGPPSESVEICQCDKETPKQTEMTSEVRHVALLWAFATACCKPLLSD